jgi:hypothetical protein
MMTMMMTLAGLIQSDQYKLCGCQSGQNYIDRGPWMGISDKKIHFREKFTQFTFNKEIAFFHFFKLCDLRE